jgi:hypothetical protein
MAGLEDVRKPSQREMSAVGRVRGRSDGRGAERDRVARTASQ